MPELTKSPTFAGVRARFLASSGDRAEGGIDLQVVEGVFTTVLVLLKLNRLRLAWGVIQGFDCFPWLAMFRATRWFEPLPTADQFFGSYHPPLSYLLCHCIYRLWPHEVEASQIMSTLAILGAAFALRSTLRTAGVLWTVPGLVFLYVTTSLPLVVWQAIETSYDALVFMWYLAVLAISARLFWNARPANRPSWEWRRLGGLVALGLAIAAGLLTKFNTLFAIGVPFLVIFARRGVRALVRESVAPLGAVALGLVLVAPLYYTRYYVPFHTLFPNTMDWQVRDVLAQRRAWRDAHPWHLISRLLRFPQDSFAIANTAIRNSVFHSLWFQTWKRDAILGDPQEPPRAVALSNFYMKAFTVPLVLTAALLAFQRRALPAVWRSLGVICFVIVLVYVTAITYFAWTYPYWEWMVIKAKYVTPGVLWIGYSASLPVVNRSTARGAPWQERLRVLFPLVAVALFMFVNHLMPVY